MSSHNVTVHLWADPAVAALLLTAIYQRQILQPGLSFEAAEQFVLVDYAHTLRTVENIPKKQASFLTNASSLGTAVDA